MMDATQETDRAVKANGSAKENGDAQNDRGLAAVKTITASELKQLWQRNATVPASIQRCVHSIVEDRAQGHSAAMAVCAWDGDLTYAMLDQLASALAARLVRHGVGPDILVPLCFHKSKWTPVAILAVLKAGGAFVLLDPSLPEQRLQCIVEQLDAQLIISSDSNRVLSSRLVHEYCPVIVVGDETRLKPETEGRPESQRACPESTCYVVFTSGSTGTPKGIMITHENAASAMHHHVLRLELTVETRMFDFASYSTDVSISNLFLVWAAGGCLCVPKESDRNNNPEQSIVDLRANAIDITPSLARLLSPDSIPQVKLIIFGGEALRVGDVERWWGRARIIHEYGSSECTQNSTMNCDAASPAEVVRIGTGAGLVTWIVDPEDHNILLPPGSIGELLLEGPLVGRGYLHDAEKTAAAFIEAPTWLLRGGPGCSGRQGRLYKSGDLVQYNEDGSLIFFDRKDGQAKVRGQRVDLGEVEHWVRACLPGTTEIAAEVVLPGGERACSTLVVFLQASEDIMNCGDRSSIPSKIASLPVDVEDELAQHLPSYMVPAALIFLEELPMTATGKMHRSRLREIGSSFSMLQLAQSRTSEQSVKQQPTSDTEHLLQMIWAGVLGINESNIGLEDSFFHLGGDSIAAMRVVAESRRAGLGITVADILRHRRLQPIAASAVPLTETIAIDIPVRRDAEPLQQSFDQQRIWLQERRYPGCVSYLKPFAIRLQGPLHLLALCAALSALSQRHEMLRTSFSTDVDVHLQHVQQVQPKTLTVVGPFPKADGVFRLKDALRKDHTTPFNLKEGVPWRASLYICSEYDHVLSLVLHNLLADGWSVGLLSRELAAFYSAAVRGQDPLLHMESLPIQYGDYATWQRQHAQTAEYRRQLDYWASSLAASHPAELPLDRPRPAIPSGLAEVEEFELRNAAYSHLQKFCKEKEVTPSVVMLSALAATHYRLTGVGDAVIGTAYAARDRLELKHLIGLLANIHCIRFKAGHETFGSLVEQLEATTIAAFAKQDVPWAEVISRISSSRDMFKQPLFRIVVAFNNTQDTPELGFDGLDAEVLHTVPTTRYDIEFVINQDADGLQVQIYFAADIYDRETIKEMVSVFHHTLRQGLDDAEYRLSTSALVLDSEDA